MSRYLERARYLCRLLSSQFEAFEDSTIEEIDANWRRIYQALGRQPFGGEIGSGNDDEDFMLIDSFTLADDWTFEPTNPNSIHSCIGSARENARQVRNVIGGNLWSCLNGAYLGIADLRIGMIWNDQPREFYRRTSEMLQTISGINDNACYRDHGWHFMQLGKFVERSQLIASLVNVHLMTFPSNRKNNEPYWRSLLEICEARVAYHRLHSLAYKPKNVIDLLVSDPLLSHSIYYSLLQIETALESVSEGMPLQNAKQANQLLRSKLDQQWSKCKAKDSKACQMLSEIAHDCRELHDEIVAAHFDYDVESALPA